MWYKSLGSDLHVLLCEFCSEEQFSPEWNISIKSSILKRRDLRTSNLDIKITSINDVSVEVPPDYIAKNNDYAIPSAKK